MMTLYRKGLIKLNTIDYDKALYFTNCSAWDDLLVLMVRTKDDVLSKKIEHFLHACHFESDWGVITKKQLDLFQYLDHAVENI